MGVYVLQVVDDSSFKGVLNIADTVTALSMARPLIILLT